MGSLIEVKHLKKYFKTASGQLHAVDDVSFSIPEGHWPRGSTGTPIPESTLRAPDSLSALTVASHQTPVQTSQRPQSWAVGSSSASARKRIRHI